MIVVATSTPTEWKIGSFFIKLYQKTDFTHCLIVKDGLTYEASHGSVHSMPFSVWRTENKIVNLYILPANKVDMEYVQDKVSDGVKYGVGQILRIAVKYFLGFTIKRNNGDSRLICSEFVGRALRLDWVDDYTSPKEINDYLKSLRLHDE